MILLTATFEIALSAADTRSKDAVKEAADYDLLKAEIAMNNHSYNRYHLKDVAIRVFREGEEDKKDG